MTLLRRLPAVAAALAAATVVPVVIASAQTDTVGIKLLEVPVELADDPRAQVYIIDHVNPGDRIERRVQVSNNTGRRLSIELYPGAAEISDARFKTLPPEQDNELVAWTRIEPDAVDLPPGRSTVASVSIDVPPDASSGERYGVVWAQPPAGGDGGAEVVNRVGIRLYLSVGTGNEPVVDFEIDTLEAALDPAGRPVVRARVENTGERALDLTGELELSDGPAGLSAGPFPADRGTTLAPGGEGDMTVALDPGLPAGPWLARMIGRSGQLEKAVEATIVFPEAAGESAEAVEATEVPLHRDRGVLLPLALGLLILALFLVLLVWFLAKRRRREDEEEGGVALDDAAAVERAP